MDRQANYVAPRLARRAAAGGLILILVLLFIVALGEANSAAAKVKRTVIVCNNDIGYAPTIETKPSDCVLWEPSRFVRLNDLTWSSWGGKRAVAHGKIFAKESPQPTRIRLVLARLDSTKPCPFRWYSRVTIRIVSGSDSGRETIYNRPAAGDCGLY